MKLFKIFIYLLKLLTLPKFSQGIESLIPVVVVTWNFQQSLNKAWESIYTYKKSAIESIEDGCIVCEKLQCDGTVGYGGSPDENGETTLDALLMDGVTMDIGAVGALRNVKDAISVARHVLENTEHTLLVGELATNFAIEMGFKNETLETISSRDIWKKWKSKKCQPNFWKNVTPNSSISCGPYTPKRDKSKISQKSSKSNQYNHDTIGMIAIDIKGHIGAGTSTNGARNKIPGRVGDSPIPGSGAYADQDVGAAAATGDGDIMMRFLPSFLAVEQMRIGASPSSAAETAIRRIIKYYPNFSGAVIAVNKIGEFGAACHGWKFFPFIASNPYLGHPTGYSIPCLV